MVKARKRKYPGLTLSEIAKLNVNRHKFTEEERSNGGVEARWLERTSGKKLNHGMLFGKKVKDVKSRR